MSRRVATLRSRLGAVLAFALILVVAGVIASSAALSRLDSDSRNLIDRVSPGRVQVSTLTASWLDQETGVRGYVLTHRSDTLAPYTTSAPRPANTASGGHKHILLNAFNTGCCATMLALLIYKRTTIGLDFGRSSASRAVAAD